MQTTDPTLAVPEAQRHKLPKRRSAGYRLYNCLVFLWKFFAGAALTQFGVGSILLFGWTFRAAQRLIFKRWWKASPRSLETTWESFAAGDTATSSQIHWPNWIIAQNGGLRKHLKTQKGSKRLLHLFKAFHASLTANIIIGIQGLFNTCVVTLPGCTLMAFAWYAGWLNSFNKGYEQALIGPTMWAAGALLFCSAMFYVPMAQMRQASTGNWKSFYEFKLVWSIVRKAWLPSLGLAVLYTLFSLPFMILKIAPGFFPQISPDLANATPERALEISKTYFFWCGLLLFPALLFLRLTAAKIYSSAVLDLVQSGHLSDYQLGDAEWVTLHRLGHLEVRKTQPRHYLLKAAGWIGTRMGRAVSSFILLLVWFSFVVQILVSEFIIKTETGWMNQPLVQFPVFNYTPKALEEGKPNI